MYAFTRTLSTQARRGLPDASLPRLAPVRTQAGTRFADRGKAGEPALGSADITTRFRALGLAELNARASMLQRHDNKYILRDAVLWPVIDALAESFDMLEIDGRREFTYDTCYFDDAGYRSYHDQLRGRRRRCKVRTRRYVDSDLCFLEVKLKGKRGITLKRRMAYALSHYGALDDAARAYVRRVWRDLYGDELRQDLRPVVWMSYRRMTLVAKQGGERMTIDRLLQFSDRQNHRRIDPHLVIIETKSGNANGIADKILRSIHQHPTKGASKYCMAMAALEKASRCNKLLPALRKLDMVPPAYRYDLRWAAA